MTCANVFLTIAAAAIFVLGVWPGLAGTATPWILGILALAIIVVAWSGVTCKWCANMPAKPVAKAKRATK